MNKTIVLILLLLFAILNGYSQTIEKSNFISISAGPSFPIGKLAEKNSNNYLPGFAKTGEHLTISFEHQLNKKWNIAVMLRGQRNATDAHSLEQQYSQKRLQSSGPIGIFYPYNPPQPPPPPSDTYIIYPNWKFNKGRWLSVSLLIGSAKEFPLNQKNNFSFVVKAMAGAAYISTPKLNGSSISDTVIAHYTHNSVQAFGFAYLLNGGLKYKPDGKVNFLFNINYWATSQINFKKVNNTFTVETNPYSNGLNHLPTFSESSITRPVKESIGTINIIMGVAIAL